jgi:hypothetical protein
METIRGKVTQIQFMALEEHTTRYVDNYTSASTVAFNVGDRPVAMSRDESTPTLNDGDDVEVSGTPNPNSGVLEVQTLRNLTTGATWTLNAERAAKSGCPLAMSALLVVSVAAFVAVRAVIR